MFTPGRAGLQIVFVLITTTFTDSLTLNGGDPCEVVDSSDALFIQLKLECCLHGCCASGAYHRCCSKEETPDRNYHFKGDKESCEPREVWRIIGIIIGSAGAAIIGIIITCCVLHRQSKRKTQRRRGYMLRSTFPEQRLGQSDDPVQNSGINRREWTPRPLVFSTGSTEETDRAKPVGRIILKNYWPGADETSENKDEINHV